MFWTSFGRFEADASLGHGAALPAPEERGGCLRGLDRLLEGGQHLNPGWFSDGFLMVFLGKLSS